MRLALALVLLPVVPLIQANRAAPQAPARPNVQDAALPAFLDRAYDEQLALSPESQTQLGLKTNYDRLDDYTDAASLRAEALAERQLVAMRAQFKPANLGESARVSYRLFEYEV